jgi:hypothetical protein
VSSEASDNDRGAQEILYWGLALVGLIAIKQLWTERLRPWIESTWGQLRAGELVDLPIVGSVDQPGVIGIAVLTVAVLVAFSLIVAKIRRRRRALDSTIRSHWTRPRS